MGHTEYPKGAYVRLHTNDDWNDLHGIVDDLLGDFFAVFCVTKPLFRYYISTSEVAGKLELIL